MVAVHNDYRLNGELMTFWLFTTPDGRAVKGEGRTDAEALDQVRAALSSPEAVGGWSDMSNAPKDGTAFLAMDWKTENDGAVVYWDDDSDYPYRWRLADGDIHFHADRFTHWMRIPPLAASPPAPAPQEKENGLLKYGWPIQWHRCPKCGSPTITDGYNEWCTFIGGRDAPSCSWQDVLSLNFQAVCRLLKNPPVPAPGITSERVREICDGWLDTFKDRKITHVSPEKFAADAVTDIRDAILTAAGCTITDGGIKS